MRVAYYSPLPPERSGIADYSALLLPALRRRVEVTLARPFRRSPRADVALYHLGNNPDAHGWIYRALRRRPGLVVLHEVSLHGLVAGLTLGRGDRAAYLDAVERDAGSKGRAAAERSLAGLDPPVWEMNAAEIPLLREALDFTDGVVVHSRYAEQKVRESGYDGPVHQITFPARPGGRPGAFALPLNGRPLLGGLGKVNGAKRIPQLLRAFGRLRRRVPEALLVLAGEGTQSDYVRLRLEPLGLEEGRDILLLDYLDEQDFHDLAARCDVCISLRGPTLGETSASAISALASGTALVVSDVGWFSELPDTVAAKVSPDEWEIDHLAAVLELLVSDEALRAQMGEAGREYALREFDVERAADAYAEALAQLVQGRGVASPERPRSAES
jgi:glycosyltransferase involved in cell wall biosynthesis